MTFDEAQKDMNHAYFGGAAGVLASGVVWSIAGIIAFFYTNQASMLALFFGGMFIHPLGMLIAKALKRPGNHCPENPLGKLALEGTFLLFVGLFIAFYVAQHQAEWFYPIMLTIIGARYLTFQTLYGSRIFWILGGALILAGAACIVFGANFETGALIGGATEIIFSAIIFQKSKGTAPETA